MSDWRCRLGFHDWEMIRSIWRSQLDDIVRNDNLRYDIGGPRYEIKVCVRCLKMRDTLTPAIAKAKAKYQEKLVRRALAREKAYNHPLGTGTMESFVKGKE